jgi:cytochrome c biogenesis factor
MIAELGQLCLILALCASLVQAGVPLLQRLNKPYYLLHIVKPAATSIAASTLRGCPMRRQFYRAMVYCYASLE